MVSLEEMRKQYDIAGLDRNDLRESPTEMFRNWFEKIQEYDTLEPNAMTLATSSPSGKPTSRVVLLKEYDEKGVSKFLIGSEETLILVIESLQTIKSWSEVEIDSMLVKIQEKLGLKTPQMNQPIRIALTGSMQSPSLGLTIKLMGRNKSIELLNKALKFITK